MPKEITHILLAEKIRGSWQTTKKEIGLLLQKYPQFFNLGSISPDIFFYDLPLPWENKEQIFGLSWGNAIHGTEGENTMAHIYAMADILQDKKLQIPLRKNLSPEEKEKLAVFAMGYLTHVALDTTLHPIVYYFSGNYYAPEKEGKRLSETRHRAIETLLDLWLLEKEKKDLKEYSLKKKAYVEKKDRILITKFYTLSLRMAFGLEKNPQNMAKRILYPNYIENDPLCHTVDRSFKKQYFFNKCFHNRILAKLAFFINKQKKDLLSEFTALYYPERNYSSYQKNSLRPLDLSKFQRYFNPLTNQENFIDYQKITSQVILKAIRYILAFYELWQNGISEKVKKILNGPSLNVGLPAIPTSQMKHFSPLAITGNFEFLT